MTTVAIAEFRNFMSGGGFDKIGGRGDVVSSGGNRSVAVHPTTNFHVHAVDSASVSQFFHANSKSIASALDRAVRHGSTLGMRAFTP